MRRAILTAFTAAALVVGFVGLAPLRQAPVTALRFAGYLVAIEQSGQQLGFWDRVTYGLVLAGSGEKEMGGPGESALL